MALDASEKEKRLLKMKKAAEKARHTREAIEANRAERLAEIINSAECEPAISIQEAVKRLEDQNFRCVFGRKAALPS